MLGYALLGAVLVALLFVFSRPYIGVYLWTWISLMNPHRLTWGFVTTFPFALIIAAVTAIGIVTGRQKRQSIGSPQTTVLLLLVVWVGLSTLFAFNPEGAAEELDRFVKIQIFILLTMWLVSDREKLDGFLWVMVVSIGFFGVKGGLFTILTGGGMQVRGPPGTFIGGNNELAVAMLMVIPLMRYLQLQARNRWLRWALLGAMLLTAVAILGTQSRGALIGIMAIGLFFWWKSPNKLAPAILAMIVGVVVLAFMPETWWERMGTIQNYEEDKSAMGRINAWTVAWEVAKDRLTGGGAGMFIPETFLIYAPNPQDVHDVHSIYFEMLGEQGFIGLALFLTLGWITWRACGRVARICKNDPERLWAARLAPMLQVSLIGYASAGAFLGLAYYDFYYDLVAVSVILGKLALSAEERSGRVAPGPVRGPARRAIPRA